MWTVIVITTLFNNKHNFCLLQFVNVYKSIQINSYYNDQV